MGLALFREEDPQAGLFEGEAVFGGQVAVGEEQADGGEGGDAGKGDLTDFAGVGDGHCLLGLLQHRAFDLCRIEIGDNGVGISKEDQQRIFMPFVRIYSDQEYPGIGLGLPSVRKAVELMGGRVGVDSKPGEGSRFWIELTM